MISTLASSALFVFFFVLWLPSRESEFGVINAASFLATVLRRSSTLTIFPPFLPFADAVSIMYRAMRKRRKNRQPLKKKKRESTDINFAPLSLPNLPTSPSFLSSPFYLSPQMREQVQLSGEPDWLV